MASSQGMASRSGARSWCGGRIRQQSCAGASPAEKATVSSLGSQGAHIEALKLRSPGNAQLILSPLRARNTRMVARGTGAMLSDCSNCVIAAEANYGERS